MSGTYTALCATGKGLFVTKKQDCPQDSSCEQKNLLKLHRRRCVTTISPLNSGFILLPLSNVSGDIALFVFTHAGFPLWRNVKFYPQHCGDYLSRAAVTQVPAPRDPRLI